MVNSSRLGAIGLAGESARSEGLRRRRAARTRDRLLEVGERLIAERGVADVSARQIAEEAGQANHSALAYHVGTKHELVTAVLAAHHGPMMQITARMMEAARGSNDVRDRVACLYAPYVRHLATLGSPSWTARFVAQVFVDPACPPDDAWWQGLTDTRGQAIIDMWDGMPDLPADVVNLRVAMTRIVLVHTCAEREAEAARTGVPVDWAAVEAAVIDAITAILTAPTTTRPNVSATDSPPPR